MAALQMNAEILNRILDERAQKEEIISFLEEVIDDELARGDEADCDLIDACVEVLESETESESFLRLLSKPSFLRAVQRRSAYYKRRYRTAVAVCACAVLLVAATVGSLQTESGAALAKRVQQKLEAIFTEESTAPTPQEEPTTQASVTELETEAAQETSTVPETTEAPVVKNTAPTTEAELQLSRIYGIFPDDLKTEYVVGETLDMQGVRVMTVYEDGSEREIPLDDCLVNTQRGFPYDPGSYTIQVFYQGLSFSYPVRVTAQKESVILNSIYGSFEPGFDFTTDSPASPDLSSMTVTAVYSDGSERVLSADEYDVTVSPNFLDNPDKTLVTVSYLDRTFSFILTKEMQ